MDIRSFLTLDEFKQERPNLAIMTDNQLQEAINVACDLLDSKCNGLISMVLDYEGNDPNHEHYRTDFEKSQIKKAFVFQAQYNINLGNDFTQGSSSFSTGGINGSFQRPIERDPIAPGVYEFLARARVYKFINALGKSGESSNCRLDPLENKYLTRDLANDTFVTKYQEHATSGSIAYVNESKQIAFKTPNDFTWQSTRADTIKDPNGQYKEIKEIINLAWFGPNGYNTMTRQEIKDLIWKTEYWREDIVYPRGIILQAYNQTKNEVATFISLADNNRNNDPWKEITDPQDNYQWWKHVGNIDKVDFDRIVDLIFEDSRIQDFMKENWIKDTEQDGEIAKLKEKDLAIEEMNNQQNTKLGEFQTQLESSKQDILSNQNAIGNINTQIGEIKALNESQNTKLIEIEATNNTQTQKIGVLENNVATHTNQIEAINNKDSEQDRQIAQLQLGEGFVKTTGNQDIRGQKVIKTNVGLQFSPENDNANYLEFFLGNKTRHWILGRAESGSSEVQFINSRGPIKFDSYGSGSGFNFSNKPITNVPAPVAPHHAANKQYVDSRIDSIPRGNVDWSQTQNSTNFNFNGTGEFIINVPVMRLNGDVEMVRPRTSRAPDDNYDLVNFKYFKENKGVNWSSPQINSSFTFSSDPNNVRSSFNIQTKEINLGNEFTTSTMIKRPETRDAPINGNSIPNRDWVLEQVRSSGLRIVNVNVNVTRTQQSSNGMWRYYASYPTYINTSTHYLIYIYFNGQLLKPTRFTQSSAGGSSGAYLNVEFDLPGNISVPQGSVVRLTYLVP